MMRDVPGCAAGEAANSTPAARNAGACRDATIARRPAPEFIAWRQLAALMTRPSHTGRPALHRRPRAGGKGESSVNATVSLAVPRAGEDRGEDNASSPRPPQDPARPEREHQDEDQEREHDAVRRRVGKDRKSTRLNSSHSQISYAVFCLKKKKKKKQ